jgi:hypothetical protein
MALQPLLRPWPLLKFRNLFFTDGRTPLTSDQPVVRPLPTHRGTQTQNKRTHRHLCLEWDSNPRSQCSSERRYIMLRPRGHCDRQDVVYGLEFKDTGFEIFTVMPVQIVVF